MSEKVKLDIPLATMVKVAITLLLFYVLFLIRDVLLLLFVVAILVAALRPVVQIWGKKIGHGFSVFLLLLILVAAITGFVYLIVPPLVEQISQLAQNIPAYADNFSALRDKFPSFERALSSISENLGNITSGFINFTFTVFGGLVSFLTAIILTVYLLLDKTIFHSISKLIPGDKRDEVASVIEKISQKVGNWLRGQLILAIVIGVIVYFGLSIIGIPYALTLAVIAGVLEIVPIVGPIIAGIVAVLVALSSSVVTAIIVGIFYIVLQQLENNILVPKIMQKAVGLSPAIIIIAILIGGKLFGILGGLLAVPVAGIVYVVIQEWETVKIIASHDSE